MLIRLMMVLLLFIAPIINAKTVFLTGTIKTVAPKFEIEEPSIYYKGVKEYVLTGKTASGSGCRLTGNIEEARNVTVDDNELVCLVEWLSDTDSSWQAVEMDLQGRPLGNVGTNSRTYRVSFFSGSSRQQIVLFEETIEYELVEPPKPQIVSVTSSLGPQSSDSLTLMTHNRKDFLTDIVVEVEPKPYDQIVRISPFSQECAVQEGSGTCRFDLNDFVLAPDQETLTGQLDSLVQHSDKYNYNVTEVAAVYQWDYRPPVIEEIAVHAVGQTSEKIVEIDVDGNIVRANNNEALVVVSSPHVNDPVKWWLPSSVSLDLTQDKDLQMVKDFVTLRGEPVGHLFNGNIYDKDVNKLTSTGQPEQYGDKFVYRIDIRGAIDGNYLGNVQVQDLYENASEADYTNLILDRLPPEVYIFSENNRLYSGGDFFFFEHLVLTAQDLVSRETTILDVMLDGELIEVDGEFSMAKAITSIPESDSNTTKELIVSATDDMGNNVTRKFILNFLPLAYSFNGLSNKKVSLVQSQKIGFIKTKSNSCNFYETEDMAVYQINRRPQRACTIEWLSIPDGLEPTMNGDELIGTFYASGLTQVQANIWIHDGMRRKNLVETKTVNILVHEPDAPKVTFPEESMFDEGYIAVEQGQTMIGRYVLETNSADVITSIYRDGELIEEALIKQNDRYESLQKTMILKDRFGSMKLPLWTETEYSIKVRFALSPNIVSENSIISYTVPTRYMRLNIEGGDREVSTQTEMTAKTALGIYNRLTRKLERDPVDQGEWDVQIVEVNADRSHTPITEWQTVDNTGTNDFTMGWADYDYRNVRYAAVARVKSPNPKYKAEIVSKTQNVNVLQGHAIRGEITTNRVSGTVPLNVTATFNYENITDRKAAGDVSWFVSSDGAETWDKLSVNNYRMSYRATTEGVWLLRAEVKNRFTDEITYSDHLQIMAYKRPNLRVEGPTAMLVGNTRTLRLMEGDELANMSDLIVEWSFDGGETYEMGTNTVDVSSDTAATIPVYARAVYVGYETDPNSWSSYRHNVKALLPRPVVLTVSAPKDVEVGDKVSLTAKTRAPYSGMETNIVTEFEYPDGTKMLGDEIQFEALEEHREWMDSHIFKVRSWLEGTKNETMRTVEHKMKIWEYQFPEFGLVTKRKVAVAPTTIDVFLRRPPRANEYESFKFDFDGHGKLEILRSTDNFVQFQANKPGIFPVSVHIEDDRGNHAEFMEYVEVLEADPMNVDLTIKPDNEYWRAPVRLSIRPTIKLGHPFDRIADYKWYINDEFLGDETKSFLNYPNLGVGVHEIKLEVESNFGQTAVYTEQVEVVENQPPTCELQQSGYSQTVRLESKCIDTDGRMKRYEWEIDDYKLLNAGYRINLIRNPGETVRIVMRGYDDSGDYDEVTTTVTW